MIKKQDGFTLIELLAAMAIFMFAIAAASGMFRAVLTQFKQQTKIGETNIEGIIGLEILRSDIEQAGYGLPWDLDDIVYAEAVNAPESAYNDAPGNPPRAIVTDNNIAATLNSSDYFVIKASNVAINKPTQKWAYSSNTGANNIITVWENTAGNAIKDENLETGDRVIVLNPMDGTDQKVLINSAGVFFTDFTYDAANPSIPAAFSPISETFETYMIYGIDPDTNPIMPFNRADYYISTKNVPIRCAAPGAGTGVLVKVVLDQADGDFDLDGDNITDELPLLDCVADMQVILTLDMDNDGAADTTSNADGSVIDNSTVAEVQATLGDAGLLRERLKEVRILILTHEGQKDTTYTFNNFTDPPGTCGNTCITVGSSVFGRDFDLSAITDYENYRWKIYSMALKLYNLE